MRLPVPTPSVTEPMYLPQPAASVSAPLLTCVAGGRPSLRVAATLLAAAMLLLPSAASTADCAPFEITGDRIEQPLAGKVGQAGAGARVAADRQRGDCVICHRLPLPEGRFHGNLGPDLRAVGLRLSPAQLRLRVAANRHLNPESIMPDYCRSDGRHQVAEDYRDHPILSAQDIEDLVAWLSGLDAAEAAP